MSSNGIQHQNVGGRLSHKTAVITGGTTGIGFETARQFVEQGARVVITGQDSERLSAAAQQLGARVIPIRADVRSLSDLDGLARRVAIEFGESGLDIIFANAGVGSFAPIESVDEGFYDNQFDINVKGVFFTVQKLVPLLRSGGSVILNASSVNGKGVAAGSVYFATKAAVRSLARTLAAELAPRGIRVNAVSPGLVPTPFIGKMGLPQEALDGFAQMITSTAPLGRLGKPEEIAPAAVFLASDEAAYITALDLAVDGGWMNV
jgi:NAD(P)-dependent dehydrogenase (short-subunit alcohol dehydrogenase family)